jgi:hypothetical protein
MFLKSQEKKVMQFQNKEIQEAKRQHKMEGVKKENEKCIVS